MLPIRLPFVALAYLLALPACRSAQPPSFDAAAIRNVPVQVNFGGQEVFLETYLWRDFMPVAPPDGRPLSAVLRLRARGEPVSGALAVDSAWVVWGDRVWAMAPRHDGPVGSGDMELIARGGPKWPPGQEVDVVVRLRGRGASTLLRAPKQKIRRTD